MGKNKEQIIIDGVKFSEILLGDDYKTIEAYKLKNVAMRFLNNCCNKAKGTDNE